MNKDNKYYFIPLSLQETLKPLINSFEGYICITTIEPTTAQEADKEPATAPTTPTGIKGQTGEIAITANCKGFILEGNLQQYGYRNLAIELGCIEFHSAEALNIYIEKIKND